MIHLLKYLKGSGRMIFGIFLLLAAQAWCELELPNYTSRIVTQGIQQKGIEDAVPDRLSEQSMEDLLMLSGREAKEALEGSYTLTDGIWVLDRMDKKEREALAEKVSAPEMLLYFLSSDDIQETISAYMGSETADTQEENDSFDIEAMMSLIPEGKTPIDVLRPLPAAVRETVLGNAQDLLARMPESVSSQVVIRFVATEYEKLGENLASRQIRYLTRIGARMLLLALLAMAAAVVTSFLSARLAASAAKEIRGDVFRKVIGFNSEEFHRFSTASLITRSTNDIQQVQIFLAMGLRLLLFAPIMAAGGIIKVVQTDVSLSWTIVLAVALLLVLILVLFVVAMPRFTMLQTLIDKLNLVSREQLTGVMVTRAFSAEKHEEERFEKANRDLTGTMLFVNRCMTFMMPVMMIIMNGVSVLIVYAGAHAIDAGRLQVGDMMAFIQYAMQIILSFLFISLMSILIPRANVAAKRINEVLSAKVRIQDAEHTITPDPENAGTVEFDHVTFAYPDAGEPVLTDISFRADRGQTVAFIGSTGSGKSSLVNLIPRFYDVTDGCVKVDGVDVRQMDRTDLRSRIGYVPQKSILFSGTIRSNICYGSYQADEEEMKKAAAIAQAQEFIREKDFGYDYGIAQGGTNVSGGQRQRLAIARAIARKPEILIFDDSFSALDFKTDAALRKALKEETAQTTVLIVAQRISTIMNADLIVVLDEGKMAGSGTHSRLMEECEVYRQIAVSQLSEEELAV